MTAEKKDTQLETVTFWEHLEAFRWTIIRVLLVLVVFIIIVFSYKDFIFTQIILAPLNSDFILYRLLCKLSNILEISVLCPEEFNLQLINIHLSGQFIAHLGTSIIISLLITVPYLFYEIWKFISPALYNNERKNVGLAFLASSVLFYVGVVISYFLIFPLTIRFLGMYTVSELVPNQISIQSYMNTLYILVLALGIMFELPVLAFFLSRLGVVTRSMMKAGRKYALVVILIIAAVITPTTDPFTLMLVTLPIYLLYELSIPVCKK
jgi:sec-independent protein translocase protein TatC